MVSKTFVEALKDNFKSKFIKKISHADTVDSLIELLESKLEDVLFKLEDATDKSKIKRLQSQKAVLEMQLVKARSQRNKNPNEGQSD